MLVKELRVGESFHIDEELAGIVPMAVPSEQEALTTNIMENGLKEPVVLYLGKVVDGRCRIKACLAAGVAIRARDLDDQLTREEVAVYVKSVNTRRNLSTAQKIMVASKESLSPGSASMTDIAKSWAISRGILGMANYVSKHEPDFIEPLFNGLTVDIIDAKGNKATTNKISAIYAYVKRENEDVDEAPSYNWNANSHINTQIGKDWFYDFKEKNNVTNINVLMELAERANDKFKEST